MAKSRRRGVACRAVFGEAAHSFRGKFLHAPSLPLPLYPSLPLCLSLSLSLSLSLPESLVFCRVRRRRILSPAADLSLAHVKSEFPTN